jgi:adenosylhomocysteinase
VAGVAALAPGVHDVPQELDREVARTKLAALRVGLDVLTPEQDRYLSTWRV